jgi:GNAT superfamily N-acetyltransferase
LITLTNAAPADADAIASLLAELDTFYGDTPAGTPDERAGQVRAALLSDPPAARARLGRFCTGRPAAGLTTSLYLKELYVAQAYRRTGTGRLLIEGLHRIAAERGCSRVEWTTDTSNPGAQQFCESLAVSPLPARIFYRLAPVPSLTSELPPRTKDTDPPYPTRLRRVTGRRRTKRRDRSRAAAVRGFG